MELKDRIKTIRDELDLNQRKFSAKIQIAQGTLAQFETGVRTPKDIHITAICREFNVNEEWLRTGKGEMFIKLDTFSLDDYAKEKKMTELEKSIIKAYLELEPEFRETVIDAFKEAFMTKDETSATEENIEQAEELEEIEPEFDENELTEHDKAEIEAFKKGLLAEKRARTYSVLQSTSLKKIN